MSTHTMNAPTTGHSEQTSPWGILIEFDNVDSFMDATEKVRDTGFRNWDTFTPFPVHHIEEAMGMRRTILPWVVMGGGITGAATGLLMQWWMNAVAYQLVISGKPLWSIPANIPVIFELTVLFSAFGAVFGMLGFNQLPRLHHPLFSSERFKRVTNDRFFIALEATDRHYTADTEAFARSLGGISVEIIEEKE